MIVRAVRETIAYCAVPVDAKENASQSPTLNYRERPRKIAISLCLVGILAGGVVGELLRESMATATAAASHQHQLFTALLNSPEVQAALAAKASGDSPSANEMIAVNGPWARDLFWQDGRVAYFVLADGSFYFDSVRPPVWVFPMVLLCPVLGFLIPWGVMKGLSWMGVGYFAKKQAPPAQP
jgi:hypothetical protein